MAYSYPNYTSSLPTVTPTSLLTFGQPEVPGGIMGRMGDRFSMTSDPMSPMAAATAPLTNAGVYMPGSGSLVPQISTYGADPMAQVTEQAVTTPVAGTAAPPTDPLTMGGVIKNTFLQEGGGLNMDNILSAVKSIGGIYSAIKGYGLAKDSLALSKRQFETNLANQTKSYNTALEDRAQARASYSGISDSDTDAYIKKHRL